MGGIEDRAGHIDQAGVVEPVQDGLVKPSPDTSPGPDQEPAVGGGLRYPETRRQSPPGAPADQHIHDRGKQRLIRRVRRSAALRPYPVRRDQRLRDLPQPVRNDPAPRTPPHARTTSASPHRTRSYSVQALASAWHDPPGAPGHLRHHTGREPVHERARGSGRLVHVAGSAGAGAPRRPWPNMKVTVSRFY